MKTVLRALLCLLLPTAVYAQPVPPVQTASLTSTTCTGSGCVTINTAGYGSVGVQITGTWSGTAAFTGSIDRADYSATVNCTAKNSTSPITTTTGNGLWTCDVTGLSQFRVAMTAMASGTAVVSLQLSSPSTAAGQAPAGSGGTSSAFTSAFPSNGTASGFKKTSDSSMQAGQLDDNLYLQVNCKTGCSGASDTTGSSVALGALNAADTVALSAQQGLSFHLAAGTLTGTLAPELSFDGGSTYPIATKFVDNTLTSAATIALSNPNAAQDISILVLGGATHARVRVSAYTSGTATGHLTATTTQLPVVAITGNVAVTAASLPLPTGASTEATLSAMSAKLPAALDGSGFLKTHEQGTAAISAASLPLPTGAAADSSLTTIDTDLKANIVLKAGTNVIGKVGIDQTTPGTTNAVEAVPDTASGVAVSECDIVSAASTNSTSCKGSAGNFYGYEITNTTTTVYYLRIYNTAAAPTCSSATGFIRSIPIPPAAAAGQVGGIINNRIYPFQMGTGIGYCITGGSSSTDNTNAAIGIFGRILLK